MISILLVQPWETYLLRHDVQHMQLLPKQLTEIYKHYFLDLIMFLTLKIKEKNIFSINLDRMFCLCRRQVWMDYPKQICNDPEWQKKNEVKINSFNLHQFRDKLLQLYIQLDLLDSIYFKSINIIIRFVLSYKANIIGRSLTCDIFFNTPSWNNRATPLAPFHSKQILTFQYFNHFYLPMRTVGLT